MEKLLTAHDGTRSGSRSGDAGRWPSALRLLPLIAAVTAVAACIGCYDSRALVDQARNEALRSRMHEVNLGFYRTTMPRDRTTNAFVEMELQLFGTVPQYRIPAIEKQLKADRYRLRHETLTAIRETTRDELADPDLTELRARLTKVANHVLADAPIKSIGFEHIRIVYE